MMNYHLSFSKLTKRYKLIVIISLVLGAAFIVAKLDTYLPNWTQKIKRQESTLQSTITKITSSPTTNQKPPETTHFNLTIEKIKNGFFIDNEAFLIKDGVGEKLIEVSPENQRILAKIVLDRPEQPTAYLYAVQEPVLNSIGASGNPYRDQSKWGGGKQCEDCWGQLATIWEKEVGPNSTASFLKEGKEVILLYRGNPQPTINLNTNEILYEVIALKVNLDSNNVSREQDLLKEPVFLSAGGVGIDSVSPDQRFVLFRISPGLGLYYQYLLDATTGELTNLGKLVTPIIGDQDFKPRWNYFDNTLIYFATIREPEDATKEPLIQGKITYNPISKKEVNREQIIIE